MMFDLLLNLITLYSARARAIEESSMFARNRQCGKRQGEFYETDIKTHVLRFEPRGQYGQWV